MWQNKAALRWRGLWETVRPAGFPAGVVLEKAKDELESQLLARPLPLNGNPDHELSL